MNDVYYLYSFCNGELVDYKEFENIEDVKQFLNNLPFLEDVEIIQGRKVSVDNV